MEGLSQSKVSLIKKKRVLQFQHNNQSINAIIFIVVFPQYKNAIIIVFPLVGKKLIEEEIERGTISREKGEAATKSLREQLDKLVVNRRISNSK